MSDALALILVALIGQTGIIAPILWSTRKHAKEANEAVNCKPKNQPRISEVVDLTALAVSRLSEDVGALKAEVHEIRREQASVARALGDHLRAGD